MDYYILYSYLLVSLEAIGPFDTPEERDKEARKLYQEHRNDCGYHKLVVPKGAQVEIDSYSDDFLEGD